MLYIGAVVLCACNQNDPTVLMPEYDLNSRSVAAGSVYEKVSNETIKIIDEELTNVFNIAVGVKLIDKESPFDNILYKRLEFDGNRSGLIWLTTQSDPLQITYVLSGEIVNVSIADLERVVEFKLSDAGKHIENCSYIVFGLDTTEFFDFEFLLYKNCEGLNPTEFLNMRISELLDTVGVTTVMTSSK